MAEKLMYLLFMLIIIISKHCLGWIKLTKKPGNNPACTANLLFCGNVQYSFLECFDFELVFLFGCSRLMRDGFFLFVVWLLPPNAGWLFIIYCLVFIVSLLVTVILYLRFGF